MIKTDHGSIGRRKENISTMRIGDHHLRRQGHAEQWSWF